MTLRETEEAEPNIRSLIRALYENGASIGPRHPLAPEQKRGKSGICVVAMYLSSCPAHSSERSPEHKQASRHRFFCLSVLAHPGAASHCLPSPISRHESRLPLPPPPPPPPPPHSRHSLVRPMSDNARGCPKSSWRKRKAFSSTSSTFLSSYSE